MARTPPVYFICEYCGFRHVDHEKFHMVKGKLSCFVCNKPKPKRKRRVTRGPYKNV